MVSLGFMQPGAMRSAKHHGVNVVRAALGDGLALGNGYRSVIVVWYN